MWHCAGPYAASQKVIFIVQSNKNLTDRSSFYIDQISRHNKEKIMVKTLRNTKERLLETAIDLIWKSSYGSVSVDDICKEADVKKGSFYHYFPSKIDLAIAAIGRAFENYRPVLDEAFSPSKPSLKRFEDYVAAGYKAQSEITREQGVVCGCPFISLASEMAPQDESIRKKTNEIINYHKSYYETTLRDMVGEGLLPKDTDIAAKASKVFAFVMGQLVMARIQNSLEPMHQQLETGLFRLLGIQKQALEEA